MLSLTDRQQLLRLFPDVKLSYDSVLHRKVSADLYYLIPKGPKSFLWITQYNRKNITLLLTVNHNGAIKKIVPVILAFANKLATGTILYGTLFNYKNNKCFCIEDLHWLEGRKIEDEPLHSKLNHLSYLFSLIQRSKHSQIIIGAPVMSQNYDHAYQIANELPYSVYGIQSHKLHSSDGPTGTYIVKTLPKLRATFRVKATVEADIYSLYCNDSKKAHGIAMIPTYKCSVMMNGLFRNIKENSNLDLLEESDDEDDFENVNLDKYVDLKKSLTMECIYIPKFNKWHPDTVLLENSSLTNTKDVLAIEQSAKNYSN